MSFGTDMGGRSHAGTRTEKYGSEKMLTLILRDFMLFAVGRCARFAAQRQTPLTSFSHRDDAGRMLPAEAA